MKNFCDSSGQSPKSRISHVKKWKGVGTSSLELGLLCVISLEILDTLLLKSS